MMRFRTGSKISVPRVPCVPEVLKGTEYVALRGGTPIQSGRNTACSERKRCSRLWGEQPYSTCRQAIQVVTFGRGTTAMTMGRWGQ